MLNKKISWFINSAGFDPDYRAILDKATALGYSLPTAAQKTTQNKLIMLDAYISAL